MLGNFKGKGPDKEGDAVIPVPIPARMPAKPSAPTIEPEPKPKPETVSFIGPDMTIVGNIVCEGRAQIFGHVEGELGAVDLLIGEGAQVSGNVVAQELTICGHVKGTIRAVRVKLKGTAVVEGDIFHRSLSIEENALFEGSSRRVENPIEATPRAQTPTSQAPSVQASSIQASSIQMPSASSNGQQKPAQSLPQAPQMFTQPELAAVDLDPSTM
jgi:cytoskeletal protein CcmA (bactofilin family)